MDGVWPDGSGVEALYREDGFETTLDAVFVQFRRSGAVQPYQDYLVAMKPQPDGNTSVELYEAR